MICSCFGARLLQKKRRRFVLSRTSVPNSKFPLFDLAGHLETALRKTATLSPPKNECYLGNSLLWTLQDIEKIELESKKIFQALAYIKDVVDKKILQMLPGSASIVLETILEIHQLLNNYFIDQER